MSSPLNLVFCGTPQFAVPTLDTMVKSGFCVSLVVTQPDRPQGRGLGIAFSPVKQEALALGLPLLQPEQIKTNEEFRARLGAVKPDAIVVVGYGRIIPQWMIELPRWGNLNLHASLLPKYRGAAPIQWAIARGETVTGVTTMRIDAGLDTGDILQQQEMAISPDDTAETLGPRLATLGAGLVVETLRGLEEGTVRPSKQDNRNASLAPILRKKDGQIDFSKSATEVYNCLRGFQPWPGAYAGFRGRTLRVWTAKPLQRSATAGELYIDGDRLFLGCAAKTALELLEVQPEGKKRMEVHSFIQGYRPRNGERLESLDIES